VLIVSQNVFRSARRLMEAESLFMLTTQDPTSPENAELFPKRIGSTSPYTHHTHLIPHHPTSFSSDISNTVYRESLFYHMKNHLQQFVKSLEPSRDQPWKTCSGTGWRDSNGFPRTMVTTLHKLNSGGFTFLGFFSESEMLHLGGTPYKYFCERDFGALGVDVSSHDK
jgi:hypothetical protein